MRTRSSLNRINATSKLVIKEREFSKFPKVRVTPPLILSLGS